ncbi:Protein of unknown function [Pyronema omphalodes CBS 100304]|uniref:Uncharacterized protein n=1 Tax=Pyronema omphalodes (strain CBS 100304) TaxID=1076935 RepID=U4LVM5_PYROM|nr:Protein of unknown function [Pyronema omphalodes CBS 100304]
MLALDWVSAKLPINLIFPVHHPLNSPPCTAVSPYKQRYRQLLCTTIHSKLSPFLASNLLFHTQMRPSPHMLPFNTAS